MIDLPSLMANQIATTQPETRGSIDARIKMHGMHKTVRELLEIGRSLKTKIGVRQLTFYIREEKTDGDSTIRRDHTKTIWEDELQAFDSSGYEFVEFSGSIPVLRRIN